MEQLEYNLREPSRGKRYSPVPERTNISPIYVLLVIATGSSLLYCSMDDFSKVNETRIKVLSFHPSGHVEVRCPRGKKKYIFSDQKHCFDTVTP